MKILNTLSSTFFAKRGWMHFTGTIAILYLVAVWFGWHEFTLESKIIGCTIGGIFLGAIINVGIEFAEEQYVKIKLKDPFVKSAQKSDVFWGAFAGPFGAWIGILNQNLSLAAWLLLSMLAVSEVIRISKVK